MHEITRVPYRQPIRPEPMICGYCHECAATWMRALGAAVSEGDWDPEASCVDVDTPTKPVGSIGREDLPACVCKACLQAMDPRHAALYRQIVQPARPRLGDLYAPGLGERE